MPFIIASCVLVYRSVTWCASYPPRQEDLHDRVRSELPRFACPAGRSRESASCPSDVVRVTNDAPNRDVRADRHLRYVDAYIIPSAAIGAKHFGAMVAVVRPNNDAALVLRPPRLRPRSAVAPR